MTLPDPGTDPVEDLPPYGFWARLFGAPVIEDRVVARLAQLISTNAADTAALEAARDTLAAADTTIDQIEPPPLNHKQKGTKR